MKRILSTCIATMVLSTVLMAKPAKREVLDSLLQVGDTIRYEQMVRHQTIIQERVAEIKQQKAQQRRIAGQAQTACPLNIAPRGLVILVNFQDKEFITSYDEMHNMINGDNYSRSYKIGFKTIKAQGSARQYFIDQSWGQYQPQFDVVGPYTVSKNYSYYGQNRSEYNTDVNACEMIIEACQLADADGVDFTQYDNNNDGEIDFVYVFYAGYGEADGGNANTIWPHTYWVKDACYKSVKVDGKYINAYACGNELNYGTQIHDGVGTFCHEFSHVLGLPDLYSTGGNTEKTKLMGDWDIMDSGPYNNDGNTPPAYSAYERFFMGWLKPTQITGNKDIILHPLNSGRGAALIAASGHNMKGNDPNPTTFYLLENREKTGWDAYLPGKGLLITKIAYNYSKWIGNTVNNTKTSLGVDIIEADGKTPSYPNSGYSGKAGDTFPGSEGVFEYTAISGYEITNIGWATNNIDIEFRLNAGGFPLEIGQMTTAIEDLDECTVHSAKCIVDGRVVIVRGDVKYDVLGRALR